MVAKIYMIFWSLLILQICTCANASVAVNHVDNFEKIQQLTLEFSSMLARMVNMYIQNLMDHF